MIHLLQGTFNSTVHVVQSMFHAQQVTVQLCSPLSYRPSTGNSWVLDRQTATTLLQLLPSLDSPQLQGPLGAAIAAVMSSDPELRQTLLKGACFFALAAGKAGHGSEVKQMPAQLRGQEAQAGDVVALVETSVKNVIEEVGCSVTDSTADQLQLLICLQ